MCCREIQDYAMFMGYWEVASWPSSFSMLHSAFNSALPTDKCSATKNFMSSAWKMRSWSCMHFDLSPYTCRNENSPFFFYYANNKRSFFQLLQWTLIRIHKCWTEIEIELGLICHFDFKLCRYLTNPGGKYWWQKKEYSEKVIKERRVFRYIMEIKHLKLLYHFFFIFF